MAQRNQGAPQSRSFTVDGSLIGDETFERNLKEMDSQFTSMLSSRGSSELPMGNSFGTEFYAPGSTQTGRSFDPNDIEKQVKGALQEAMGSTYSDVGLSRYNIPQANSLVTSTFSPAYDPQADSRTFAKGNDLKNPKALSEGDVDLPRASLDEMPGEQAFPTPSLIREEVYTPPAYIPGVDAKQQAGLSRIGDALSAAPTSTPTSPPRRISQNARISVSGANARKSAELPAAGASTSIASRPSSGQPMRATMGTAPVVQVAVVQQPLITKDNREPVNNTRTLLDGDEPQVKLTKRDPKGTGADVYGEEYDDFISFAIKGKDPRYGFKYGCDPRNNPIMCTVLAFSIVSLLIAIVLLVLPNRTQVMFIFGILFAVVAGLFCLITTFLTSFWRRIRF